MHVRHLFVLTEMEGTRADYCRFCACAKCGPEFVFTVYCFQTPLIAMRVVL